VLIFRAQMFQQFREDILMKPTVWKKLKD